MLSRNIFFKLGAKDDTAVKVNFTLTEEIHCFSEDAFLKQRMLNMRITLKYLLYLCRHVFQGQISIIKIRLNNIIIGY